MNITLILTPLITLIITNDINYNHISDGSIQIDRFVLSTCNITTSIHNKVVLIKCNGSDTNNPVITHKTNTTIIVRAVCIPSYNTTIYYDSLKLKCISYGYPSPVTELIFESYGYAKCVSRNTIMGKVYEDKSITIITINSIIIISCLTIIFIILFIIISMLIYKFKICSLLKSRRHVNRNYEMSRMIPKQRSSKLNPDTDSILITPMVCESNTVLSMSPILPRHRASNLYSNEEETYLHNELGSSSNLENISELFK